MATQQLQIQPHGLVDANGGCTIVPYSVINSGTTRNQFVANFDQSTDGYLDFGFEVPSDYVGSVTVEIHWTSQTTTGNVIWDVIHRAVAAGSQLLDTDTSPASRTDSLTTSSKPGAADQLETDSVSITETDWAAGEWVQMRIQRDADNASDTKADDAQIFGITIEYSDA